MDGTFKHAPDPFYQFFSIHSFNEVDDLERRRIVASISILMPGKSELMYLYMFELIFKFAFDKYGLTLEDCKWKFVNMDYESGLISAIFSFMVGLITIFGCFFHYCQAIYRKVQKLGLLIDYNDEVIGLKKFVKKLYALAFCP